MLIKYMNHSLNYKKLLISTQREVVASSDIKSSSVWVSMICNLIVPFVSSISMKKQKKKRRESYRNNSPACWNERQQKGKYITDRNARKYDQKNYCENQKHR